MTTTYPTTKQVIPNPSSTDLLENATPELDHDYQHSTVNDTIEALQDKVGIDGDTTNTSHSYKLSEVTSTDKAVGKTATQTLTNKTLTSPVINVGSDARGDMYYRNGSGAFTRLPVGANSYILSSDGTDPQWIANPASSDASTTVKGVVEIATTAEISAGTSTGGTGATLVVPASAVGSAGANKIVQFDGSGNYPAANGSAITNITNPATYASGTTTKNVSDAAGTQTIAHGLGKTPKYARITAMVDTVNTNGEGLQFINCFTVYNGTTQSSLSIVSTSVTTSTVSTSFRLGTGTAGTSNNLTGAVTFDSTNISIAWTKNGSPASVVYTLLWEAFA